MYVQLPDIPSLYPILIIFHRVLSIACVVLLSYSSLIGMYEIRGEVKGEGGAEVPPPIHFR
jgi:hypothetical protein